MKYYRTDATTWQNWDGQFRRSKSHQKKMATLNAKQRALDRNSRLDEWYKDRKDGKR